MVKDIVIQFGGAFSVRPDVVLVADDVQAYRIVHYTPYNLTDHIFKVTATRADGVVIADAGAVQDNTAFYVLKNNMYAIAGELILRLTLCSPTGTILTDKEVHLSVVGANGNPDISGGDRVPLLDKLLLDVANVAKYADYAKQQGDYAAEQAAKLNTSQSIAVTLQASAWVDGVQTLTVSGLAANGNGIISVAPSATAEQRAAARSAMLSVTGQAAGELTIAADGTVPEIDIPVVVILLG